VYFWHVCSQELSFQREEIILTRFPHRRRQTFPYILRALYQKKNSQVSALPHSSLNDLLTIFLSTAGFGGIVNVVNGTGGSSTVANPDTPVTVVSYP
jgi:hypothetical protein